MDERWTVVVAALLLVGILGYASSAPALWHPHDGASSDRLVDSPGVSPARPVAQRAAAAEQSGPVAAPQDPPPEQLVSPAAEPSALWPYTSRTRSTAGRTLAINLVVDGDPRTVRVALTERSDANWTGVGDDVPVTDRETVATWQSAHGSERYTYVATPERVTGEWIDSDYQLGSGTYLGARVHVRAYGAPSKNWTALQAHGEYWDWFRLRHTVTSVAPAASFVREDLADEPYVRNVTERHHGLRGGGSDGSFIVVELAGVTLLLGAAVSRIEPTRRDVALPVAIVAIVLGVRLFGIAAETRIPSTSPKLFAAVLYPVLVAGPPLAVAGLARNAHERRTAAVAAGALAVALVLDATLLGFVNPPQRLLFHRLALVAAFGLLAWGIASTGRRTTAAGVLAWLLALAVPLFGVV